MEDLAIVDEAGKLIMRVKEDMIGPAREQAPRPTMIDDVIKDVISETDGPIPISMDANDELPLVLVDPVQINRVFVNLLNNAAEAMEGQASPQIKLAMRPDSSGEFVLVDVVDNGVGIPEADLDKIWITFHTTKGLKGHAGLGLPACRLILEQIGGHISVTSQTGKGTTFTVSLPVYKGKESGSQTQGGDAKILIIDDADAWRKFAAVTLKENGYKVDTAGEDYPAYDLILIDDILEAGNALEIMQAIKAAGAIGKTVVVSTNPRVERTKERKLIGIQNLVLKPHTRTGLLIEVKAALS
jgi:CheY-like chemotaxis protein